MNEGTIANVSADQVASIEAHCRRIASSGLVPDHFKGNPSAVYTVVCMARSMGEDEVQLMQACHFVGGKMGLSSAFLLSRLRRSGAIVGTVRYRVEGEGDSLAVWACCLDSETGETIEGPAASMRMAKAERWTKNAKYQSMPGIMLRNRALAFLVRYQYPDVLFGLHTVEELRDVEVSSSPRRPARELGAGSALAALEANIDRKEDAVEGELVDQVDDDTVEAELEPGTGTDPEARTSRDLFEAPEEGR